VPQSLAQYYANQARVQVSPRRSGTNTPLKVYQQIASGVPLVATNIYSHTQVLSDEVAFLVELDPKDMGQGILTALTDYQERKRRAEAAKQLYAEKYSRQVYTEKMRSLLNFVMNS
jgi:glycosyltransferase involved in cell wall biosynthesis